MAPFTYHHSYLGLFSFSSLRSRMENDGSSSSKVERKTLEKQRRTSMKNNSMHLASLIPNQNPMIMIPLADQLHEAANYIKIMKNNIENMKERKKLLLGTEEGNLGFQFPVLEIKVMDSALEVVFISGSLYQLVFYEVMSVLQDEGAEIVSVSFYRRDGKAFHTIHSQITDSRAWEATRICERLKNLVQ